MKLYCLPCVLALIMQVKSHSQMIGGVRLAMHDAQSALTLSHAALRHVLLSQKSLRHMLLESYSPRHTRLTHIGPGRCF